MKKFIEFILIAFHFVFLISPFLFLIVFYYYGKTVQFGYNFNTLTFIILGLFIAIIISSFIYYALFRKLHSKLSLAILLKGIMLFVCIIVDVDNKPISTIPISISFFLWGTILLVGSKFSPNFRKIFLSDESIECNRKLYRFNDVGLQRQGIQWASFYYASVWCQSFRLLKINTPSFILVIIILITLILFIYSFYFSIKYPIPSDIYPVTEPEQ